MNRKTVIFVLAALGFGLFGGYFATGFFGSDSPPKVAGGQAGKGEPLFYRNPMNPEITSPTPAKDEMGMDYIPVYAEDQVSAGPAGTVLIDPVTLQNIGVRTGFVETKTISNTIRAPGRITYDESLLTTINARTEGWVEELFVNRTGDFVKADTILLDLYSPQLVSSQQEYLLALKAWEEQKNSAYPDIREGAEELKDLARKRLELLNVPEHQIRELEESREVSETLHIHSPAPGTILEIGVREGQHITPQTNLYRLADLSRVWVMADIFEHELAWVTEGAHAMMSVDSLPGKTFHGAVDYIYPFLNPETRTARARLVFDNPELFLKPDSFANVSIEGRERKNALVVPAEAVIRTGTRNTVFVVKGEGRFEPRAVQLGVVSDDRIEVASGLEAGEEVVTSGQFLLDSESRLNEAIAKMTAPNGDKAGMELPAEEHSGHNMEGMTAPEEEGSENEEGGHDH